jgi:hypothetical protein
MLINVDQSDTLPGVPDWHNVATLTEEHPRRASGNAPKKAKNHMQSDTLPNRLLPLGLITPQFSAARVPAHSTP